MAIPARNSKDCFCDFKLKTHEPHSGGENWRNEIYKNIPCHIAIQFFRNLDPNYQFRYIMNPHVVKALKIDHQGETYQPYYSLSTRKAAASMEMFMQCGKTCMPTDWNFADD